MPMVLASDQPSAKRMFTLSGKPKSGKTVTACTISDYAPAKLDGTKPVTLKDTVLIQFDMDGAESARRMGLNPYLYDLSSYNNANDLLKAFRTAMTEVEDAAKKGEIKYVILDPLSTFDEIIATDKYREISNSMAAAKQVKAIHMDVARTLRSMPCTVVCTFHVKYNHAMATDETGVKQEGRAKANSLDEKADYVIAMSGDNAAFYKKQASYNLVMHKVARKGSPTEYRLLTDSISGYEAGGRDGGVLSAEEQPNMHQIMVKLGYVK